MLATRFSTAALLVALAPEALAQGSLSFHSRGADRQVSVPVTIGYLFGRGALPAGRHLGLEAIPTQADIKTRYPDRSAKHVVLSALVPDLGVGESRVINLVSQSAPAGEGPSLSGLLATSFDAVVSLSIGGTTYTASAASLLTGGQPEVWLSGPLAREWLVSDALRTAAQQAHPHLSVRFHVRAYAGLQSVRVAAVVENTWSRKASPKNYSYDLEVTIPGQGVVMQETNVTHYRQSRWRRVFWWGTRPEVHVAHDPAYLMQTGQVPTYDRSITVSEQALSAYASGFATGSGLMGIGELEPYMPAAGGRMEIAPLPGFAAAYLMSQDERAKEATLGHGEQAGAWPMHYRDQQTGLPISLDTYPNMTIVGYPAWFPICGGDCSSPYEPEVSHHPSLAYVPYLVTGDYYFLEEMQFWANWVLLYGPDRGHGFEAGLVVWDQVRGQAWALRTLAQGAAATPDDHPLKPYLVEKLNNNLDYLAANWIDSNPLGYVTNTGAADWLDLQPWIATWMDDFLTWAVGHAAALGLGRALPVLEWKARFPVGRMTHPDMCWVLASTYWPTVLDDIYLGGTGEYVSTWDAFRRAIIWSWNDNAFVDTASIAGKEQALIDAECDSLAMAAILGWPQGTMIGYPYSVEGYPANLRPAVSVAVEAGVPQAAAAWSRLEAADRFADYSQGPQWAIVPGPPLAPADEVAPGPPSRLQIR